MSTRTADPISATGEGQQTCPLCQTIFDPSCSSGGGCSASCPMSKGCAAVSCPSCGYSFPRPSGFSAWLARFFASRRTRAPREGTLTLCDIPAGQLVKVTGLSRDHSDRLSKLAAFGIVEGCELRLRQRHPAFIVEVAETTLALDAEVAEAIEVAPVLA